MYPKVIVKEKVQDHDADIFSPFESLGLRYLVQFGAENVAPDKSNAKSRRICVSNLAMRTTPLAKGQGKIKNDEIKDVDQVVQRPRAVLSSPDNDYLIGKMNEKAFKRVSTPKTPSSGRFNLVCDDVENARIRVRGTNSKFEAKNCARIKDHSRPLVLNDKKMHNKTKTINL